ncbi:ABC transporter substrate-binding protein [Rheinheimera texasensis]|uniref:substrate-binding periplasmic protein n=1 Tax=Rheinheimera texasensis TaxID=306205 RepID=UPI0032B1CD26
MRIGQHNKLFCKSLTLLLFCFSSALLAQNLTPARILTSEKMPFNYLEGQQISGLSVDLLQLMFNGKLPAPVELMPWPRAYATALEQPDVLLFTMGKTAEREALGFQYIGPVSRRFHSLYAVRSDLPPVKSFADIKKHRLVVAGLRAGWLSEQFKAAGIAIETVGSYQQGMDMLLKNRAQLWLSTDLEEQVLQAQLTAAPVLTPVWRVLCSENYFALSPGSDPALVRQLQQKYRDILHSAAPQAIRQKWQTKLALPLEFAPVAGFYLKDAELLRCKPTSQAG